MAKYIMYVYNRHEISDSIDLDSIYTVKLYYYIIPVRNLLVMLNINIILLYFI